MCSLPKRWAVKTLEDVCEKTLNIKWQEHPNKEFEYIDLSAVSRESLSITESSQINIKNAPSRAKKIIKTDDIIFATTRPTLKRIATISNKFNNQRRIQLVSATVSKVFFLKNRVF